MKKQKARMAGVAIGGLFKRSRGDTFTSMLNNVESVGKLVESGWLNVNVSKPYVRLSLKLYHIYALDDKKFSAFLNNVLAFINFHRGRLDEGNVITPEEGFAFSVIDLRTRYTPPEGESWDDYPRDETVVLLLGAYQNNRVRTENVLKG